MREIPIVLASLTLVVASFSGRASDGGEQLCMALTSVEVHDMQGRLIETAQAQQIGNAMSFSHLSSNQASQAMRGSMGLSAPLAQGLLDFNAGGGNNSNSSAMDSGSGSNSSSGSGASRMLSAENSAMINKAITEVMDHCNASYFDQTRVHASLDVQTADAAEFIVRVNGHMGQFATDHLEISEFAVIGGKAKCTRTDGTPIATPIQTKNNSALFKCTKNSKNRAVVAVNTNAGPTPNLTLVNKTDITPPPPARPTKQYLRWSTMLSPGPPPADGAECPCLFHARHLDQGELEIRNDCSQSLSMILVKVPTAWVAAVRQAAPPGMSQATFSVPPEPAPGRYFARVTIAPGQTTFAQQSSEETVVPQLGYCPVQAPNQ